MFAGHEHVRFSGNKIYGCHEVPFDTIHVAYDRVRFDANLFSLSRDLDLNKDEFSVCEKGEKVRVVFQSDHARDTIRAYLTKRTDTDDSLFAQTGKNINTKKRNIFESR